jgi:hypothetical protein
MYAKTFAPANLSREKVWVSFFMEVNVSIGAYVQEYPDFVAGVTLQREFRTPYGQISSCWLHDGH